MSNQQVSENRYTDGTVPAVSDEVSPDSLLTDFRGRRILTILVVTVVFHVVLIFGTSYSFLRKRLLGTDTSEMSKEERVKVAVDEASSALGEIAERHDLTVDDITAKFDSGGSRASQVADDTAKEAGKTPVSEKPADAAEKEPERKRSEFEKKLMEPEEGPDEPSMGEDTLGLP